MSGGVEVSILVPSIGRPSLARTVREARTAARMAGRTYEIVVVDDSADGQAQAVCREVDDGGGDLRVVTSASRNISIARNTGVASARGDWLAFLDDDEWPEADWLVRQFQAAIGFEAGAVIGPVRAHYPDGTPRWIVDGDPYSRWFNRVGTPMRRGSTANALVRRDYLNSFALRFDESLGRSGGEDADLFGRFARCGLKIVAGDGLVHESIAIERCSARDLIKRAMRVGQTYALSETADATAAARSLFALSAMAKTIAFSAAALAFWPISKRRALPLAQNCLRNAGKISFLAGASTISYYRVR
jgi:succinoglycan biosynthesis protein ExoM